jgi:hypothetical protein
MKRRFLFLLLLLMSATGSLMAKTPAGTFSKILEVAQDSAHLASLNQFWEEVSRTVRMGDFEGYSATCHKEGVLVSGKSKTSVTLDAALEAWKPGFMKTKAGNTKDSVAFRFSQRIGNATTAHETGIFHFTSVDSAGMGRDSYVHFEALLVHQEGSWKILMEYQKGEATKAEWEALQ